MSILGTIQPDVLPDAFGRDLLMNNGFNQRWLFVYPGDTPPTMYSENVIAKDISEAWNDYINRLLDLDFSVNNLGTLYFLDESKKLYVDYYDSLQTKKADACSYMSAVYSKLQIAVERWAGITHLLGNEPNMSRILPEEMEFSIRCANYFERCAGRVYMKLTKGRKQPEAKAMGKEEMIANVYHLTNPISQSAVADALGVTQQYISKCLKKYPKLLGCRLYDCEYIDNEEDISRIDTTS